LDKPKARIFVSAHLITLNLPFAGLISVVIFSLSFIFLMLALGLTLSCRRKVSSINGLDIA
jgi:hypothetical protein